MSGLPFRQPDEVCFGVRILLRRSASPADEAGFQRRTEDWLARHGLRADGGQTTFAVLADRELSTTDQVITLLAMLDDPTVRQARVGPLIVDDPELAAKVAGRLWVEADRYDPLVHAARVLYEAGRLDAYGLLEALGGFIFRPAEYVEDQP